MRAASEVTGLYLGALFVLSLTALLTVVSFAAPGGLAIAAGLGMFVLTAIAWWRRMPTPTSFGALFVPWIGFGLAGLGPQQVTFALAFVCYWVIVSRVAWLRDERRWCTVGSVGVRIMAFGVSFAAISGLALLVWHSTTQPDLSERHAGQPRRVPRRAAGRQAPNASYSSLRPIANSDACTTRKNSSSSTRSCR